MHCGHVKTVGLLFLHDRAGGSQHWEIIQILLKELSIQAKRNHEKAYSKPKRQNSRASRLNQLQLPWFNFLLLHSTRKSSKDHVNWKPWKNGKCSTVKLLSKNAALSWSWSPTLLKGVDTQIKKVWFINQILCVKSLPEHCDNYILLFLFGATAKNWSSPLPSRSCEVFSF